MFQCILVPGLLFSICLCMTPVCFMGGYKMKTPSKLFENTWKRLEHDSRPKQKQETTRYVVFIEFHQGLRFVQNPTKSTKRRPRQYWPESAWKRLEHDPWPQNKQGATREAVINEFNQGLCFVHNPTKNAKRRPCQYRPEIAWKRLRCQFLARQKQGAKR